MFDYPYRTDAGRRRRRLLAVVIVASMGCVGVLAGAAARLWVGRPAREPVLVPVPETARLGQRDAEGAAVAALRATPLLGSLPRQSPFEQQENLLLAAPEARRRLLDQLGSCPPPLAHTPGCDPATGFAAVSTLRATVVSLRGGAAVVDVWAVAVSAADPTRPADAAWSTQRLTLTWRDGAGWLVTSMRSSPGPVAVTGQPPTGAGPMATPQRGATAGDLT